MVKPVLALALYILLILVTAALLAPAAFGLVHPLLGWPFHRYVDRCLMLGAILWLPVFWQKFQLPCWSHLGWVRHRWQTWLMLSWLLGLLMILVVTLVSFFAHARVWSGEFSPTAVLEIVAGSFLVGLIEEWLFRGVVQTVLVRELGGAPGITCGAVIFVLVHFIKVPPEYQPNPVTWESGWVSLGLALRRILDFSWFSSYGSILFLVGLILGLVVREFKNLWPAVGLHAGWVMGHLGSEKFTHPVDGCGWLGSPILEHPITFVLLVIVVGVLILKCGIKPNFNHPKNA